MSNEQEKHEQFDDEVCEWLRLVWLQAPNDERSANLLNILFKVAKHAKLEGLAYCAGDLYEGMLTAERLR